MLYDYGEGDNCPLCKDGVLTEYECEDGNYGEYVIHCSECGYFEEYDVLDCFTGRCGYNSFLPKKKKER